MDVPLKKKKTLLSSPGKMRLPFFLSFVILLSCIVFGSGGTSAQDDGLKVYRADSRLTRLTYSGSNWVGFPSLSDDGNMVVFMEEVRDTTTIVGKTHVRRMIKSIRSDGSEPRVVFADSTIHAPSPFERTFLVVGTKPPLISGDGRKVIFSLSLTEPGDMTDHYLGVINSDGTEFKAIELRNEDLASMDWKKENFHRDTWGRIANYAISDDGRLIACVVKGHFGPVSYGTPSGILVIDADGSNQRTLLGPHFKESHWSWDGFPRNPLTGGGWAFALSGDGETLLFGAQSSEEKADYDLYRMNVDTPRAQRVTSFRDRLFSFADISDNGDRVTFFYSGKKGDGVGTYTMNSDGTALRRVGSETVSRVDYDDVTGSGKTIVFQAPSGAYAIDVDQNHESLLFSRSTPGYVRSGVEMGFPAYPSFWAPNFMSRDGSTLLLTGVPVGKDAAELYVLRIKDLKEIFLVCPRCDRRMDPSWTFCPYDGTKLE
jgi:Tol biopolymer transport system component